ncbi:MAG: hypothetical protein LBU32_29750 [Clostridiales bacterium]|jgi:FtsH-binding integral membrane protein|nr:hypothetical protein [Clostridiales bacterium]
MTTGNSAFLSAFISYPVFIITILIFLASMIILILKRKDLDFIPKALLVALAVLALAIIAFFIYLIVAAGNSHPLWPPTPLMIFQTF